MARLSGFLVMSKGGDYDAPWGVVTAVDSLEAAKTIISEEVSKRKNDQLDDLEEGDYVELRMTYQVKRIP